MVYFNLSFSGGTTIGVFIFVKDDGLLRSPPLLALPPDQIDHHQLP